MCTTACPSGLNERDPVLLATEGGLGVEHLKSSRSELLLGDSSIDVLGLSGAGDNHDCQSAVPTALEHIDIATTVP